MTLCSSCGRLPAAMLVGGAHVCLMCAMQSDDPSVTRQIREMGLTETELKRMRKTIRGEEEPPQETPMPREIPELTEIEGIEVVSPAYEAAPPVQNTPRFRLSGSQPYGDRIILIFTDTETGVQYITNDELTGFSPLLDANGKPLISY